ncbi:YcxB family protein [Oscillibacter sp. MSJ-2]|uniref:YcxB family protein n=1 Tax=Dysosmobacter acutus TaxID=2841504 RepID=A0ABS6F693_9FIRM|nr:YcxB family protein [Dysosmobacter acutus]MBU5625818.1 YcxB family protein [Dysosmobacter acutus]
MESRGFRFQISSYDTALLLPQVSKALEKRTELVSRNAHPVLWKAADRLNAVTHGRTRSKLRTKIMSVICLVLGIFLFVPGLMEPQALFVPLLTGAVAVGAGIGGLWQGRARRKNRFDRPAELLLKRARTLSPGPSAAVYFSEAGMALPAGNGDAEWIPYGGFERIIETSDGFLFIFDTRAVMLQKCDLAFGAVNEFRKLLMENVPQYHLV